MNLKPFLSWCASQGIQSPLEIKVRPEDGFRYTVLKEEDALLLTDRDDKMFDLIQCPLDACIIEDTNEELADRLSFEYKLGDKSKYAPFINAMPKTFADIPRFWKPERIELVNSYDGGFLQRVLKEDRSNSNNNKSDDVSKWALACVDSRANFLPDMRYSLTPYLDMINHDASIATKASVRDDTASDNFVLGVGLEYIMQSTKKKNEEIRMSYGNLSNLQTLVDYGFVQRGNPCNREWITLSVIGQSTPLMLPVEANGKIDPLALGPIRRTLATTEELESNDVGRGPLVPFLSKRNEMETYAFIAGWLEESIYDANSGAQKAKEKNDGLVSEYLSCRADTLQMSMDVIEELYPEVFV